MIIVKQRFVCDKHSYNCKQMGIKFDTCYVKCYKLYDNVSMIICSEIQYTCYYMYWNIILLII